MKWSNIENAHVKPIGLFDAFNDEELKQAVNW